MTESIRPETPKDYQQIIVVYNLAFNQLNEWKINELPHKKDKNFIPELYLIAEIDSKIPK